jgi:predicted DNA-binding transcriptional regulator YafY
MNMAIPPKKMLILNILDILKRYTDENHRLSQREIAEILEREYSMKVDRKAVKRNLMNLIDMVHIEFSESLRAGKNGEEETIYSDWYLVRDFSDAELRLLIDSLLFSKHIPYSQCKQLIGKLEGLSNIYFKSKVKHIRNMPVTMPENKQLFYTIEVLDEAIGKERQVSFAYNEYDVDKKLRPRTDGEGNPREYIVNPYQMAAANGRYYLICHYERYDDVSNFRLDRITDIKLLETKAKDRKLVKGLEHGLDLPRHMAEHIYMFSGESVRVAFRAARGIAGDIIDWFGQDVVFSDAAEDKVTVAVRVNADAFFYWALQYGVHIEVLEPAGLRARVKDAVMGMAEKYGGNT